VLALQVLSLVRVAAAHPGGYTPAADLRAVLAGDPCGLQSALLVETDPTAGVLAPAPARPAGGRTTDAGATSPGATPWYALDPRQRGGAPGALPVVVTVDGTPRPGAGAAVEFARGERVLTRTLLAGSAGPADRRLLAPPGADAVRVAVDDGSPVQESHVPAPSLRERGFPADAVVTEPGRPGGMVVSLPRAPVLTPMTQVLPPGTRAVLDWPVALAFPCLHPEPLPPGRAGLARWRVAPPPDDASAAITYTPGLGGPLATARLLVTEHRMPTYLRDDLVRDTPQLLRWDPVVPLATPTPRVHEAVTATSVTHLRVPRLNQDD
jgi:arabinosyltransferase A/arabinosyltransferase B/arabinosyltransferase C